jgi:mono/diheme cytochrome c family protein
MAAFDSLSGDCMYKTMSIGLLVWALAGVSGARAQDQALIEAGADVYMEHCAECHGERMNNPGSAFNLKLLGANERPRFDKALNEGKGQMPAWAGQLSPAEYDQLWAYIRSRAN